MKINKFLCILLVFSITIGMVTIPAIAEDSIKVLLNGAELLFDVPPQLINNRTMVPMRVIFEALGADVYFISENENQFFKRVVVVKNDIKLFFTITPVESLNKEMRKENCANFDEYYLDSKNYTPEKIVELDVAPQIINDRTLIPLRAVSESLGVRVEWNGSSQSVLLMCDESFVADKNGDKTFFDEYLRSILRPSINPKIHSNTSIPEFDIGIPMDIRELANDIYNVKHGIEAILKIIEKFGEPEDEGGPGFPVPVWHLENGKITFMTFYGVVYENDENTWFLTNREARLGDVLRCELIIHSLMEYNTAMGIGEVLLKDDNTYLFAYSWQADSALSDWQKESFFINNRIGEWEIKFEEGYSYDTDITNLGQAVDVVPHSAHVEVMGIKIAEIIFTGQNGSNRSVSIIVPLYLANIVFDATDLKCVINPHVIKSPFTMGYV